jgi:hypothetical protein
MIRKLDAVKKREPVYNPVIDPKRSFGYRQVRWIENVSAALRFVDFADEIARKEGRWRTIDHKGWYTEDDGDNGEVLGPLPKRTDLCAPCKEAGCEGGDAECLRADAYGADDKGLVGDES